MPAVPKTSDDAVVSVARAVVEDVGAAALSMQAVADAVGIRAPSLYKRFRDRDELLGAVEREVLAELAGVLDRATPSSSPSVRLAAIAHAYRRFGRAHPRLYEMIFSGGRDKTGDEAGTEARRRAAAPALAACAELIGEARALAAARVLTAFVHGFISLENAGEFRLGPGVDDAFELGVTTVIASLRATSRRKRR